MAAGAWGQQTVNTHRSVPYVADMLAANYTASMWSARVETGHRFALGGNGLTPYVAGQGQWLDVPGVCETSSQNSGAALCYANDASASIRSELGVEADADIGTVLGAPARLRGRLAWAHEFETTGQISASFAAMPGSGFAVSGAPLPDDSALVRLVSDFALDASWSLHLQADAGFSDSYTALTGTVRLSARW
jgi:outer membrane autotransporter protein